MNNRGDTLKEIEVLAKRIVPILCDGGVIEASVFGSFTLKKEMKKPTTDTISNSKKYGISILENT